MRTSVLFVSSAFVAIASLAACGGDDGGSNITDAGGSGSGSDGGGSASCDVMANYTFPDIGTSAAPVEGDYFDMPTSGQLSGRTIFTPVLGGLAGSTATSTDILELDILKPSGAMGAFPVNMPMTFGSSAVFAIYANVNTSTMGDPDQVYLATGSVTITAIGQTDGSMITGSVAAATFAQVDATSGAPISGGCTSATPAFNFYLKQKAATNRKLPNQLHSLATRELSK